MLLYNRKAIGVILRIRSGKARVQVGRFRFTLPLKNGKAGAHIRLRFDDKGQPHDPELLKRPHVCKNWILNSYGGKPLAVTLVCRMCGTRKDRTATKKEALILQAGIKLAGTTHKVWHEFCAKFRDLKDPSHPFKFSGWDLMQRASRWAKKYPDDVRIVGCDDEHFAGSDLILIEHRSPIHYMGTSVVYIPQCTGEAPICFFLYPEHREALVAALVAVRKASRPIEAKQRGFERDRSNAHRALFKNG